jgi:hypothetical protein
MENNKNIKMLLENTVFFVFFYAIGFLFADFRFLKICLFFVLILLISYRNMIYISSLNSNKIKHYIFFVISLSIMFEASKIISYFIGILPRYNDIPFLIGFTVSSVAIIFYFLLLIAGSSWINKK